MAKGNILNPGADATIVQAATRASLASHGVGDYSEIFQAQADSYAKTMQASSAMWGKLISTATEMVAPMVQKAGERRRSELDVRGSAQSESLVGQLDEWKNEIKSTWGFERDAEMETPEHYEEYKKKEIENFVPSTEFEKLEDFEASLPDYEEWKAGTQETEKVKNNPLSKENIAKRRKINKERDAFFNAIKENEAIIEANDELLASEDFDAKAMGVYKMEIIDAFQGSLTTGEKTDRGNYFVTTYDKKTKKLVHTMHHDPEAMSDDVEPLLQLPGKDGEKVDLPKTQAGPIIGADNKPITYTDRQIKQYMIPADPNLEANLTKVFDQFMDNGYKTGVDWSPFQAKRAQKAIGGLIKKQGLDRAMQLTWGHLDKSFFEEVTSESGLSAELWGALQSTHGLNETTLKKSGMLAGIDDMADGIAGIQESDFLGANAASNMLILQQSLLNPGSGNYASREVREKIFMEWAAGDNGKIKEAYDYGKRLNKDWIKANKDDGGGGGGGGGKGTYFTKAGVRLSSIFVGGSANAWLDSSQKNQLNNVKAHVNKQADFGSFTWDKENKTYMKGGDIVPDKRALFEILTGKQLQQNFMDNDPFFTEIKDWDGTQHPGWQAQQQNRNTNTNTNTNTKEVVVSNYKPTVRGVVYPPRSITANLTGVNDQVLASLRSLYGKHKVTFSEGSDGKLKITGPDKKSIEVAMNRYGDENNMESQDLIHNFILKYVK